MTSDITTEYTELGALRHCARHYRSRRGTEHRLEHEETLHRKVAGVKRQVAEVGRSDKARTVIAEHHAETREPEEQRSEHEVHKILEQDVSRVLPAGKSCLAESKARLHEKHQHCRQQHPHCI